MKLSLGVILSVHSALKAKFFRHSSLPSSAGSQVDVLIDSMTSCSEAPRNPNCCLACPDKRIDFSVPTIPLNPHWVQLKARLQSFIPHITPDVMPICSWKLIASFLEAPFLFQNCYSKLKIQAIFMIFYCNIKRLPWPDPNQLKICISESGIFSLRKRDLAPIY